MKRSSDLASPTVLRSRVDLNPILVESHLSSLGTVTGDVHLFCEPSDWCLQLDSITLADGMARMEVSRGAPETRQSRPSDEYQIDNPKRVLPSTSHAPCPGCQRLMPVTPELRCNLHLGPLLQYWNDFVRSSCADVLIMYGNQYLRLHNSEMDELCQWVLDSREAHQNGMTLEDSIARNITTTSMNKKQVVDLQSGPSEQCITGEKEECKQWYPCMCERQALA